MKTLFSLKLNLCFFSTAWRGACGAICDKDFSYLVAAVKAKPWLSRLSIPSALGFAIWPVMLSWSVVSITTAQPTWLQQAVREAEGTSAPQEATAIVLYNTAEVEISANGRSTTHVRRAYKILNPSAENGELLSECVTHFRKVENLKGWVLLPGGRTRSLSQQCFVATGVQTAAAFYDDSRLILARLTGVEAGAVVAFEYNVEEKDWTSFFQSFEFQNRQPARLAQFTVIVPEGWKVNQAPWRMDEINFAQMGNRYVWTAKELPYQPEEPLMPSWYSLSKRVAVACYNPSQPENEQFPDWRSVARWCAESFEAPAAPDETIAAFAQQLTHGLRTPEEKLQAIATFVRDEIRFVAIEIGQGRWHPRFAATTLYNRYGDCKDKTTLMRAMLRAVDIHSAPVLANTRHAVQSTLPTPFQFNHCIVGIPLQSLPDLAPMPNASVGGWLFFDPTDPSARLGDLPKSLQGDVVLVATEGDSLLYRLPFCSPENYRRRYRAEAYLHPDGAFTAEVTIIDYGKWAAESRYRRNITSQNQQIEEWRALLAKTVPARFILSGYKTGGDRDSAWVSFQLQGDRYGVHAGALNLLKPDFFRAEELPVLTADQRHHPVWYGPAMQVETGILWHLPKGWVAEADALPIKSACGEASLSCETILSDSTLRFKSIVRRTGRALSSEHYQAARQFSQDLSAIRGVTVVLRKLVSWSAL